MAHLHEQVGEHLHHALVIMLLQNGQARRGCHGVVKGLKGGPGVAT